MALAAAGGELLARRQGSESRLTNFGCEDGL
jgi:hypothetical protein